MINVLLVDDHAVVRFGLVKLLEESPDIKVIGEASDGIQAVDEALALRPDVVLLDIYMPRRSGLDAVRAIKEGLPDTKVVMLTMSETDDDLFRAIRAGADGYVLKTASTREIAQAVKRAAEGKATLSPDLGGKLIREFRKDKAADIPLSNRELEVVALVAVGLGNREISERMVVTVGTIKTYLQRIMQKLNLKNRADVAAYAVRHGLVDPKLRE